MPGSHNRSGWRGRPLVVAAALLTMLTVAACGEKCCPPTMAFGALPTCLDAAHGPVIVAVGARANQPGPALTANVRTLLLKAAYTNQRIGVFAVDGDPKLQGSATFSTGAQNAIAWRSELNAFVSELSGKIAALRAQAPEANPLEALSRASEEAGSEGTVILVDSGLQTMAPLNFLRAGLIDANPKEVVDFLATTRQLPHLAGQTVLFVGLGATEKPQASLDTARRDNLTAIWQEIANRAGARCVATETETQHVDPLTDVPTVTPVTIPAPPEVPSNCTTSILTDAGKVKFLPDQAVFVSASDAQSALKGFADRINRDHLKVRLTGTTSSAGDSEDGRTQLSKQRAEAVKRILVQLGVADADITATGVGDHFPGFVADRDSDGNLLPDKAALNRTVIVELSGCPRG
jgi:OOP family OmpA-OmpF porin